MMLKRKNDEKTKRSGRQSWWMVVILGGAGALLTMIIGLFWLLTTDSQALQADFAYTTRCGIQFYDMDTETVVRQFPEDECLAIHQYDFSPDGEHLVYTNDMAQVTIADLSTGEQDIIPIDEASAVAWSPDGSRIAMWSYLYLPSGQTLVTYDVDSGEITDYGTFSVRYTSLSWSPNSQEVLFAIDHYDDVELVHYNLSTQELTQLTDDEHLNQYPVWTGTTALFSRLDATTIRDSLWRIHIATGEQEKLFDARTVQASVSPSGAYATLMMTNDDGYPAVYLLDLETLEQRQITPHEPEPYVTRWLPTTDYGLEGE